MQVKTHQLHLVLFHHQKSIDLEKGSSLTPRSLWLSRCVGTNDLEKVYLRLAPENTSLIKAVILLEAKTNCWKYMEMKYIISTKCYVLYLKNILTLYPWIRNRTNIPNTQILTQNLRSWMGLPFSSWHVTIYFRYDIPWWNHPGSRSDQPPLKTVHL